MNEVDKATETDIETTPKSNPFSQKVAVLVGAAAGLILAGGWSYLRNRQVEEVVSEEIDPAVDTQEN